MLEIVGEEGPPGLEPLTIGCGFGRRNREKSGTTTTTAAVGLDDREGAMERSLACLGLRGW